MNSATDPQCETKGTDAITISCNYTTSSPAVTADKAATRVTLNRAVLTFTLTTESHMRIELTFTDGSEIRVLDQRTVYLAIDEPNGQNHMRRALPHVDFTKLEPGTPMKFEETLLAPAFSPGSYIISLWIPSNEPALKFDSSHNLLLCSDGVPDRDSGLNRVTKFTSTAFRGRRSSQIPN